MENGVGVAHFLTREETAKLFTARSVPLVILSACYSETIGRTLVDAGVPSVIAIDASTPIADEAAILFAEHFYKAMARGWTIQRSFDDARQSVALDPKVGDANPPLDRSGQAETPWSERFTLIGDGSHQMTVIEGEYRESDGRIQKNLRKDENFVGRAREISDVAKAFDEGRTSLVTLWGPGGVGKTALSQAVAWWYAEREKVGAAMWASAGRDERQHRLRDLASLLSIALRSFELGVTEQSNFEEQKRAVREFLESSDAILILDNWETIEPNNQGDLWDFVLSLSNRVRVLVTSRHALPSHQARNIALQPLLISDAVKLFAQVARNAGYFDRNPNLSEEDIGILYAICERLSGYALAVQVAAGQTVSRALGEIWNDLQQYPKTVLEGIDELTGEPRGVWTSLDLSYKVLSDAEKAMFRRMSILLAPASADDVAAVTEVSRPSLDTLVRRSLVQMHEGFYSLLPVMRMYADDMLKEAGEDPRPLHLRAANHYRPQNTLESAIKASGHLYELASRYESGEAAEAFARFVPGFYDDLVTLGDWSEAHRKAEQSLRVARAMGDRKMETNWLGELANMLYRVGEYERASELYREAKKASEDGDDKSGIAGTLHQMGILAQHQGNYPQAMRLYDESLKLAKELGDKSSIAITLHQMGMIAQRQGDYAEAMRLYEESLKLAEELGDKSGIASTLHQMANVKYLMGDYPQAMRLYEESLSLKKELGDKSGIARTLQGMGMIAQRQGDYAEAMRLYEESLKLAEELGDKSGIASTLHQMGIVAQSQGDYPQAMRLYEESMSLKKELGDKSGIAITLHQMGMIAQSQGDYPQAMRLYNESMSLKKELGDKSGIAITLGQMGQLAAAQENLKEALAYFIDALMIFEQLRSPYRNLARKDIAKVRAAAGDEQFALWLRELPIDDDLRRELLEQDESDDEREAEEFFKGMIAIAQAVVEARARADSDEISALADQLSQIEDGLRKQGGADVADFIAALQALLAGEDAGEKIAALVDPLKQIAEQARDAINEGGR